MNSVLVVIYCLQQKPRNAAIWYCVIGVLHILAKKRRREVPVTFTAFDLTDRDGYNIFCPQIYDNLPLKFTIRHAISSMWLIALHKALSTMCGHTHGIKRFRSIQIDSVFCNWSFIWTTG